MEASNAKTLEQQQAEAMAAAAAQAKQGTPMMGAPVQGFMQSKYNAVTVAAGVLIGFGIGAATGILVPRYFGMSQRATGRLIANGTQTAGLGLNVVNTLANLEQQQQMQQMMADQMSQAASVQ